MNKEQRRLDYRDPEWLAEQLGLDKSTVYRYLQEGTIPAVQLGRKWLVSEMKLIEFLDEESRKQTELRRKGMAPMREKLDRFTERTQRVLAAAQTEAQARNHNFIGTEHLLLGVTAVPECIAMFALQNLGLNPQALRLAVDGQVSFGQTAVSGDIGLTARAKKAIDLAVEEARRLGHAYIGTEHLLPALLLEGEGVAAVILSRAGLELEAARKELARLLAAGSQPSDWYVASPRLQESRTHDLDMVTRRRVKEYGREPTSDEIAAYFEDLARVERAAFQTSFGRKKLEESLGGDQAQAPPGESESQATEGEEPGPA
jgi:excisionase family DNA binding protein